jgi:hypothetical protein
MNQNQPRFSQIAQTGGLVILFWVQVNRSVSIAADFQPSPMFHSYLPLSNLTARSMSISEADANTVQTWLMGDPENPNPVWASSYIDPERVKIVLAQPNAKLELTRIVTRHDLPPRVRVYAQEILIKTGQSANLILVDAYCQAIPRRWGFRHDFWGVPGSGTSSLRSPLL